MTFRSSFFSKFCQKVKTGSEIESIARFLIIVGISNSWIKCTSLPQKPSREMALLLFVSLKYSHLALKSSLWIRSLRLLWYHASTSFSPGCRQACWGQAVFVACLSSAVVTVVVSSAHQQCPVVAFRTPWKLTGWETQVKWMYLLESRGVTLSLHLCLSYIRALQSHLCKRLVQFAVQHCNHCWGRCCGARSKVEVVEMFPALKSGKHCHNFPPWLLAACSQFPLYHWLLSDHLAQFSIQVYI